jgi:hypothetical protein
MFLSTSTSLHGATSQKTRKFYLDLSEKTEKSVSARNQIQSRLTSHPKCSRILHILILLGRNLEVFCMYCLSSIIITPNFTNIRQFLKSLLGVWLVPHASVCLLTELSDYRLQCVSSVWTFVLFCVHLCNSSINAVLRYNASRSTQTSDF